MSGIEDYRDDLIRAVEAAETASCEWWRAVKRDAFARYGGTAARGARIRVYGDDAVSHARAVHIDLLAALDEARRGVSP